MQELQEAIEELRSGKRPRQGKAHETLLRLADDPALREQLSAQLMPLVANRDPHARGTAVIVLAMAREKGLLVQLREQLLDPDPGFRCDLAHAASIIGHEAREVLLELLKDRVFEVRFEAAVGLAELGDGAGIPTLIEGLEISSVRLQAFSSLQPIADERARAPSLRWFGKLFAAGFDRVAAAGVLARLGDGDARAFIVERIGRRRGDERGLAIELAGDLRLEEAIGPLRRVFANRSDPFRGAAARALGMLGDGDAMPGLVALLDDEQEDADSRLDAAEGLMYLGGESARQALEQALGRAGSDEMREGIRETLSAMNRERPA